MQSRCRSASNPDPPKARVSATQLASLDEGLGDALDLIPILIDEAMGEGGGMCRRVGKSRTLSLDLHHSAIVA